MNKTACLLIAALAALVVMPIAEAKTSPVHGSHAATKPASGKAKPSVKTARKSQAAKHPTKKVTHRKSQHASLSH